MLQKFNKQVRVGVLNTLMLTLATSLTGLCVAATQHTEMEAMHARPSQFDRDKALRLSQSVIGKAVGDYHFTASDGTTVSLAELAGQPVVISLIYTSCFHICPTTTKSLDTVVRKARTALTGKPFTVLSVGFDVYRDTPPAMAHFATAQGVTDNNWKFLSADQATIESLAQDLGFVFYPSANGFDHLVQTSVLDPQGKVYRQLYGMKMETTALIEPLKELVFNQPTQSLGQLISDKVRLFCTVYDPASDHYRIDYSVFVGVFIGMLCCTWLGVALTREWRRTLRAGR